MARWPRTGSGISSLYERTPVFEEMVKVGLVADDRRETTLGQVIADLGLAPLSADDEKKIRFELGRIIAVGEQNFADRRPGGKRTREYKHNQDDRLTVADVLKTLRKIADDLDAPPPFDTQRMAEIEQALQGAETGFRDNRDTVVATTLIAVLTQEVGDIATPPLSAADQRRHLELLLKPFEGPLTAAEKLELAELQKRCPYDKARDLLREFRTQPRLVADACRRAADDLNALKGKSGSSPIDWSGFKRILEMVAERNGISTKVTINRAPPYKAQGRFIKIADAFQQLLPPYMRAGDRRALAMRLRLRPARTK